MPKRYAKHHSCTNCSYYDILRSKCIFHQYQFGGDTFLQAHPTTPNRINHCKQWTTDRPAPNVSGHLYYYLQRIYYYLEHNDLEKIRFKQMLEALGLNRFYSLVYLKRMIRRGYINYDLELSEQKIYIRWYYITPEFYEAFNKKMLDWNSPIEEELLVS